MKVVRSLLSGEYQAVADRLDPDMAANISKDYLATMMDPVRKQHGGLKEVISHEPVTKGLPQRLRAFRVKVALSDGHELRFTITLDQQQRIAGMLMR